MRKARPGLRTDVYKIRKTKNLLLIRGPRTVCAGVSECKMINYVTKPAPEFPMTVECRPV